MIPLSFEEFLKEETFKLLETQLWIRN
jgi:hypothetical protein